MGMLTLPAKDASPAALRKQIKSLIGCYNLEKDNSLKLGDTIRQKDLRIEELEQRLSGHKETISMCEKIRDEYISEIKHYDDTNNRLIQERNELQTEIKNLQAAYAQFPEHHKGQLHAIYYMLDAAQQYNNHSVKRTIIEAIKRNIAKFINKGDDLPINLENRDFPF